ncbi:MAG: regulatory protein RecX [Lachnospiraceae bacterium]|nr:regulatory protein RecX [Lachnospiraceae bacterium]
MDNSKARCSAFDKAVNLLTFKDRTVKELEDKLKEKGYNSGEIDEAIDKLSYYGYLNDENYALSYIKDNASKKGVRLLIKELQDKGVDKFIIDDVIEEYIDADTIDENAVISNIVNRRFYNVNFNDDKVRRRVINYLLRRGFRYDSVKAVLKKYKGIEFIQE